MPFAATRDGYALHYEEAGSGVPIVLIHEFAGDHRSWEPQLRAFSRRHRVIAFAARGYPPSDVPHDPEAYSQEHAIDDVLAVMDAADIDRAHVVGLSMGGFTALHMGLRQAERLISITIGGAGYGALSAERAPFVEASLAAADQFLTQGSAQYGPRYAEGAARIPFQIKDPRGWTEFAHALSQHDATGAALTLRGVQARRPALDDGLEDALRAMQVPVLIIAGDEDDHALQPALFLKRLLPASGLLVLPRTGHTINLEEPAAFNQAVLDFVASVQAGRWLSRDPRSVGAVLKTS